MRCHLYLSTYVEQSGRAVRMRGQPPGDLPEAAVAKLIPQDARDAGAPERAPDGRGRRRTPVVLVGKNQGRRDRAPDARPRRTRYDGGPTPTSEEHPPAHANGKLAGRLAGVTDGHGSPNGAARDD